MCDPATLTLAAAAVTMAGQGFSAIQQSQNASYQAKIAERNAGLAREQERLSQENTRDRMLQHHREVSQVRGRQQAQLAANGLDIGFGSAASLDRDTSALAREDSDNILTAGANEARGFDIETSNYLSEAKSQRRAKSNALIAGAFKMGSTALGGAQQFGAIKRRRAGGNN